MMTISRWSNPGAGLSHDAGHDHGAGQYDIFSFLLQPGDSPGPFGNGGGPDAFDQLFQPAPFQFVTVHEPEGVLAFQPVGADPGADDTPYAGDWYFTTDREPADALQRTVDVRIQSLRLSG